MNERLKATKQEDGRILVDLTQTGSPLMDGLKAPVRQVRFSAGAVDFVAPRGTNDETPDNVIAVGGVFQNTDTGKIGKTIEDVT